MLERARTLLRRASVAGILMLLAGGCSDADEGADPAADTGAATTTAEAGDAAAPPGLPRRWSGMASADIIAHARSHGYHDPGGSRTTHRNCDGAPHSTECNLAITPLQGMRLFNPATVDTNGVIIARIENVGTRREAHLGIPAGDTLYWLVVREGAVLKSFLLDLGQSSPRSQNEANFLACDQPHHDGGPSGPSKAAFRSCPDTAEAAGAIDTTAFTDHTSPPWTTCSLGCCYADVPGGD